MGAYGPNRQNENMHAKREKGGKPDQKSPNNNRGNQTSQPIKRKAETKTNTKNIKRANGRNETEIRSLHPRKSTKPTPNKQKRTKKAKRTDTKGKKKHAQKQPTYDKERKTMIKNGKRTTRHEH